MSFSPCQMGTYKMFRTFLSFVNTFDDNNNFKLLSDVY